MQQFFAGLPGEAPAMPPAQFFHEVFNVFPVPHEMSHFVHARRGALKCARRWRENRRRTATFA